MMALRDTVTFIKVIDSALYTGIRGKLYVSHNYGENWLTLLEAETDVTCLWGSGSELLMQGQKANGNFAIPVKAELGAHE
ncbi:MAG: hypothetical protein IPF68_20495 [Bacteroidales bacterium]|nr:hypothetical protein [Bacteroidales bacterium]